MEAVASMEMLDTSNMKSSFKWLNNDPSCDYAIQGVIPLNKPFDMSFSECNKQEDKMTDKETTISFTITTQLLEDGGLGIKFT